MSYLEAKRAHDEQMTRVRAALAGDDPREAAITELRAQLANVTAERDALRAQLSAAEALARELKADWTDKREVLLLATQLVDEAEKFKQRAETAEAALVSVPVEALRRTLLTGYRTNAQITSDADAINAWLGEAQP